MSPLIALAAFWLWCLLVLWRPSVWLAVVPACVPILNFSPWTGWIVFDEFDILLAGALAAGYWRLAWSGRAGRPFPTGFSILFLLLAGSSLLSLSRGFADAGGFDFGWFAGYASSMNSVRVFKSIGFSLLFIPMLDRELVHSRMEAGRKLAIGMVVGLLMFSVAILWERASFPGVLEFSAPYRTVGLFWEMHVGGAAIDAYLAAVMPFAVWALSQARRRATWAAAAVFALLVGYAVLTTFSRGVYAAAVGSLCVLVWLLLMRQKARRLEALFNRPWLRQRDAVWRTRASIVLFFLLGAEVAAVLGWGTFMSERIDRANTDSVKRLDHWRHGIGLLNGPIDIFWGKGLGRLPANYAAQGPAGEFSGEAELGFDDALCDQPDGYVSVRGPRGQKRLGGQFALTQRQDASLKGPYVLKMDIRVSKATDVWLELCERHLLYDGTCQAAFIRVQPRSGARRLSWQPIEIALTGPPFLERPWYTKRLGLLSISVVNPGGEGDFDNVRMTGQMNQDIVKNGDFSNGLAHWLPAAQSYFLPWHLDNLFLETLVERGAIGLLLFLTLIGCAIWQLLRGRIQSDPLSPFVVSSLVGTLIVGLVSSIMDVPRVAFIFYFLLLFSIGNMRGRNSLKHYGDKQPFSSQPS